MMKFSASKGTTKTSSESLPKNQRAAVDKDLQNVQLVKGVEKIDPRGIRGLINVHVLEGSRIVNHARRRRTMQKPMFDARQIGKEYQFTAIRHEWGRKVG